MTELSEYRIYATAADNAEAINAERFYRITPDYILIISRAEPEKSVEVRSADYAMLTPREREWVCESFAKLFSEYIAQHETEADEARIAFVEKFRAELEKEKTGGEAVDGE